MKTTRQHAPRAVALSLMAVAAVLARERLPTAPPLEESSRIRLHGFELPVPGGVELQTVRAVSPALDHISAWVSAVGAAVAMGDLDGDGFPNEYCLVDPRTDRVVVGRVPGADQGFPLVVLDPAPLLDDQTMAPMGCVPVDLDEDGALDLVVPYWGRTPIAYLSEGQGGWRPVALVASDERWYTNACTSADLDGDGRLDLVFGNYFPDDARVLDASSRHREVMQDSMSRAYNGGGTRFLLGLPPSPGQPRFEEALTNLSADVLHGWTLAVGAADLDGDLLPELYLANDFGPDRLLHNRSTPGRLHFVPLAGARGPGAPTSCVLGRDSFKGMGVDFGDLNGDGWLDIHVSNIAEEFALQESHFTWLSTGDVAAMSEGRAPYRHGAEELGLARGGWGWDSKLADLDNDGILEVIQATGFIEGRTNRWPELQELAMANDALLHEPWVWPRFGPGDAISGRGANRLYTMTDSGRYRDVSVASGFGVPQVSRGIALADVDGDGDLDLIVANQWQESRFYRNESPSPGQFLALRLLHPLDGAGRPGLSVQSGLLPARRGLAAVGAQVEVVLPDGRTLVAQVDGGNGHSGVRSSDLHFGLGRVARDVPLEVLLRWRSRTGVLQRERLALAPGWHVIELGSGEEPG